MDWSSKAVLIAEDEDTNYLLLVEFLEPTGIKIIRASNGFEVLEACNKNLPDIILMDMKMPLMTGYEAVSKIREFNTRLPIIAQTAYAMIGDKDKILTIGCNDYLSKPIDEDTLIDMMQKYLGS
jgi:two-component system, cell cycle response regulator DivK